MWKNIISTRRLACIGVVVCGLHLATNSVANEQYNIDEFDIVGVHIGFNAEQTIEALSEEFSIEPDDFILYRSNDPVADLGNTVFGLKYSSDEISLTANFYPDLRNNSITDTSLTLLKVTIPSESKHLSDVSAFVDEKAQQATQKYGAASFTTEPSSYYWCNMIKDDSLRCDEDAASFSISFTPLPLGVNFIMQDPTARLLFEKALSNR